MKLFVHILRELVSGFAFTVGGMLVLTLPAIAVSAVHKLEGVPTEAVLRYMPLVAAGLVPYIVPLAFLLATVATFGRLAADNEWTAIRMSGRHPLAALLPGVTLAAVLAFLTLVLVGDVLPKIRMKQMRFAFEATSEMFQRLSPGRTDIRLGGFYLDAKYRDGADFLEAFIHVPARGDEPARTMVADRVHFDFDADSMYVVLQNARTVIGDHDLRIGNPTLRFAVGDLHDNEERTYQNTRYKTSADLVRGLARGDLEPDRAASFRYELHFRRALAATVFVFLFLGASTGLVLRRGTQLAALAVAIGYALVFYLLQMRLSKLLAANQTLPPEVCAWVVPAGALVAGLAMTRRFLWR